MGAVQQTIAQWTPALLQKWLRDILRTQPPDFLPNLQAQNVRITEELRLAGDFTVVNQPDFRKVGATGQPPFSGSWANYESGWQVAAFWRDPLGFVHLRGLIKSGTLATAAFTLPPGYRPTVSEIFAVQTDTGVGRVDVSTDGTVTPQSGGTTYLSLSGIAFRTT